MTIDDLARAAWDDRHGSPAWERVNERTRASYLGATRAVVLALADDIEALDGMTGPDEWAAEQVAKRDRLIALITEARAQRP